MSSAPGAPYRGQDVNACGLSRLIRLAHVRDARVAGTSEAPVVAGRFVRRLIQKKLLSRFAHCLTHVG
jgi:hypothetical protein